MASKDSFDPIQQLAGVVIGTVFPDGECVEKVDRLNSQSQAKYHGFGGVPVSIGETLSDCDL